jgi:hypothetical protein
MNILAAQSRTIGNLKLLYNRKDARKSEQGQADDAMQTTEHNARIFREEARNFLGPI